MRLDVNWHREYWKKVRSDDKEWKDPNSYDERDPESVKNARWVTDRDYVHEEVLDELERIYSILDNMQLSESQEIVKLLYEMPWINVVVHGGYQGGDSFAVCDWTKAGNSHLSEDVSEGVNLLEVLKEAKENKWRKPKNEN